MSKVCPKCKSVAVVYEDYVGDTLFHRCETCGHRGSDFWKPTVFVRITASPEVLAPKLVYVSLFNACWYSTLTGDVMYKSREEAEAETVEKLKEIAQ